MTARRDFVLGGLVAVSDRFDYSSGEDSSDEGGSQRVCASPKFFYTIGEYETSSFYCKFLSDEAVRASNGHLIRVASRERTTKNTHRQIVLPSVVFFQEGFE